MQILEVQVPDIGDFHDVPIIEVAVKPGDVVQREQTLVTLESDKATMDVPSPADGTVRDVKVKIGDQVSEGSILLLLAVDQAAAETALPPGESEPPAIAPPAAAPTVPPAIALADPPLTAPAVPKTETDFRPQEAEPTSAPPAVHLPSPAEVVEAMGGIKPHASPSVRRLARELGVEVAKVTGTGPKGRITHDDVRAYVKQALAELAVRPVAASVPPSNAVPTGLTLPPWPEVDFARFGPIERQPLSRIQKISGPNLARNWVMIPQVTYHDEADITALEDFRRQINEEQRGAVKLTVLAFLIKAVCRALQKYPALNASLEGDELVIKHYWHIGFAADTPQGLVVPVLRDAERKSVLEIARETAQLAGKAREGKLLPGEMQGASFTISSLGGIGGTAFSPIVNAPEVAILGVSKAGFKPVWDDRQFVPRLMLPLSLSADHRVIDGALATRFLAEVVQLLADLRRVLL